MLKDIEVDLEQDVLTFKTQVYCLSNVPVDKQKIMIKGKIIKDEQDMKTLGITNGITLMMMGTAEGKELKAPEKQIKFLEDMTPEEKAKALHQKLGEVPPAGLENLGNTCYMNSTLQALKRVNELKENLKNYQGSGLEQTPGKMLTQSAKQLFTDMDFKGEPFPPIGFVQALRHLFPQFNETDEQGRHKQQDAEECYTQIVQAFRGVLKSDQEEEKADLIDKLFGIELENEISCPETDQEPKYTQKENVLKLSCHIDNQNKPVDHLGEGLKVSLEGEIEKHSDFLGRNAIFHKLAKISKLVKSIIQSIQPSYLTVQFVRFYWKKESVSSGTKAGKAKILRNVSFPRVFDLYDFCTEDLKKSLDLGREFSRKLREEEDNARLENKDGQDVEMKEETKEESKQPIQTRKEEEKQKEIKVSDEMLYRPHGMGLDTGHYQLIAVVTHKGRSAEGGHYVGWVHKSGDDWYCYDDDIVTTVKIDEILQLKGGGDWHTAYLCIYRKLEVTK